MREITRTDWRNLPVGYLSPTQIWSYINCPYCFYLERIAKVPKPLNANLMIGRFTHASVAKMRETLTTEAAPEHYVHGFEGYLDAGSDAFEEVITRQIDREDTGEETPIEIELTKKYLNIGEAKDAAVNLTRHVLPQIAKYDAAAGIVAFEARVRHLGPSFYRFPELYEKLSDEEKLDADEEDAEQGHGGLQPGIDPVFPFPMKAFLDVAYANNVIKDVKTASRNGAPGNLEALQLVEYDLPFWMAGDPHLLGWDVAIKTKKPQYTVYWLNGNGKVRDEEYEYVRWRVLDAADHICAGDFPPNDGSLFCKYTHGLPTGQRAAMEDWSIPEAVSA